MLRMQGDCSWATPPLRELRSVPPRRRLLPRGRVGARGRRLPFGGGPRDRESDRRPASIRAPAARSAPAASAPCREAPPTRPAVPAHVRRSGRRVWRSTSTMAPCAPLKKRSMPSAHATPRVQAHVASRLAMARRRSMVIPLYSAPAPGDKSAHRPCCSPPRRRRFFPRMPTG